MNRFQNAISDDEPDIRVIYVSPYIPRECGIAAYTKNLTDAINILNPNNLATILAIDNSNKLLEYPNETIGLIPFDNLDGFKSAAIIANESESNIIHLQHEFGLFGGDYGSHILEFINLLRKPVVITFHTVLSGPDTKMRNTVKALSDYASTVTVMAEEAARRLEEYYGVNAEKITVIPHGVPNIPFTIPDEFKSEEYKGRKILTTFNLISRNKGIEYAIRAMKDVVARFPEALYLIIGKTHPVVLQHEGELYRASLLKLVSDLGLENNVKFVNKYVFVKEIVEWLSKTDVYITPYLEEQQITSGTLAYAIGAGKAIISTPYIYAKETLGNDRGIIVPFQDYKETAKRIIELFEDDKTRFDYALKSYLYGRKMIWENVGHKHLNVFQELV